MSTASPIVLRKNQELDHKREKVIHIQNLRFPAIPSHAVTKYSLLRKPAARPLLSFETSPELQWLLLIENSLLELQPWPGKALSPPMVEMFRLPKCCPGTLGRRGNARPKAPRGFQIAFRTEKLPKVLV